jgi:hypothetical protein
MSCKIERLATGEMVLLRVSGRIQVEHVSILEELIRREATAALDLTEVNVVDRDAVTFLALCEGNGIELRNCPAFLREWVAKEQQRMAAESSHTSSGATNDVEDL